jgi:hypothetical protein
MIGDAPQAAFAMRKLLVAIGILICFIVISIFILPGGNSRARAEREHGILLPASAQHIQCRGDASRSFLDRGAATMFEMSTNELPAFVAQLRVNSRRPPARPAGDPTVNSWNVWPQNAPTFIPGNSRYGGFRRTWRGQAIPIEMLSCSSPKGDWLHVELWRLEGNTMLIKMYTDWN